MAWVVLRPSSVNKWKDRKDDFQIELIKFAKSRLPGFACPEWVLIVEELPKTSYVMMLLHNRETVTNQYFRTGKIQKVVLRQRAAKL